MLEDFRLKVFLTVAESGSFTAAANKLGISQPAVSQNVAELEKELDSQLFDRSPARVTLTEKGVLFRGYAEQIMHWYGVASDAFRPASVFEYSKQPEKPLVLSLDEVSNAEIWASGGDIHITVKKK